MNSKCGYCGAASECSPLDGDACQDETNLELDLAYIKRCGGTFLYAGGFHTRWLHRFGSTEATYDLSGKLLWYSHKLGQVMLQKLPIPKQLQESQMSNTNHLWPVNLNPTPKRVVYTYKRLKENTQWQIAA